MSTLFILRFIYCEINTVWKDSFRNSVACGRTDTHKYTGILRLFMRESSHCINSGPLLGEVDRETLVAHSKFIADLYSTGECLRWRVSNPRPTRFATALCILIISCY